MSDAGRRPQGSDRTDDTDAIASLHDRISILEAAVLGSRAWIEDTPAGEPAPAPAADPFWMVSGLRSRYPEDAVIGYAGRVPAPASSPAAADAADSTPLGSGYAGPAPVEWQYGLGVDDVLRPDWDAKGLATILGALGSPTRLRFVQEILRGRDTVAALGELDGVGTTGQVYHHLSQLQSAGWVRQVSRGRYGVPPERVVPLLVIALAAGGAS